MTAMAHPLRISRWVGAPLAGALLASLLLAAPIRLLGLPLPEPVTLMAPAFAWAMIRPSVSPALALLGGGLALDGLWGTPAGLWALALLAAYLPVLALRNTLAGQSTAVLWVWYALSCLIAQSVGWLITVWVAEAAPSLVAAGLQWLSTVLLFPVAALLIEYFRDADVRFR